MSTPPKRPLAFLFFTLFMVLVGVGIIIPILPYFAEEMGASATDLGLIFASFSLMQFLSAPFWGKASDRIGRRPIILFGMAGMGVSFVLMALAQSLPMLYLARIIGGLLSSAVMPASMAYVADSTEPSGRAKGMGLMGAAMSLGLIFGPALGGFLGEISPVFPFYLAGGLSFLVAAAGYFLLPESLKASHEAPKASQGGLTQSLIQVFTSLFSPIATFLLIGLISNTAIAGLFTALPLFGEIKFGFGESEMAIFFVVLGLLGAVTQGALVGPVTKRWGEPLTARGGLVISGIGYFTLLLATDLPSALILSVLLGLGSALVVPAITALISKQTSEQEQGKALGVLNAYQSLGRIIGPLLGGLIYDLTGGEVTFLFFGLLFLATALFASVSLPRRQGVSVGAGD